MSRLRPRGDVVSDAGVAREPGPWRGEGDVNNHAFLFVPKTPAHQALVAYRERRDTRARDRAKADADRWIQGLRIGKALRERRS